MAPRARGRGRPPRPVVEAVQVITWYYAVRAASGYPEPKLERTFRTPSAEATNRHKGTRWNKYKAGITTPGEQLVCLVGQRWPFSLRVYYHPVWDLAAGRRLEQSDLRKLLGRLQRFESELLVRPGVPIDSHFWIRDDIDHADVIAQVIKRYRVGTIGRLDVLAVLLALIHDGTHRQREAQHFDAHLAVAGVAPSQPAGQFGRHLAWRLESLVLQKWLETEYSDQSRRQVIGEMRAISSGSSVPWAPAQRSLALGRGTSKREAVDMSSARGYWIGVQLLEQGHTAAVPTPFHGSDEAVPSQALHREVAV